MKKLIQNLKITLIVFLSLSIALTGGLLWQQYRSKTRLSVAAGENLSSLRQRYSQAGMITDINGSVLAYSDGGIRQYSENSLVAKSVIHTVGDYTQRIDNTIETRYQSTLLGIDRNPFHQLWLDIQGSGLAGDNITLTIDSELCAKSYELLAGRNGAIVVINYKTGALLVSTSSPGTSPQSVIDYEGIPETGLFNRALRGAYAPGSIFKLVTTEAWLSSEKYDPDFHVTCTGHSTIHPDAANESGDGHGEVDLQKAISQSCNVFFGELGVVLGQEELLEAAKRLNIGEPYMVDALNGIAGKIDCDQDDLLLSWLAIGQPTGNSEISMSPLEMARLAGAIANKGNIMNSHIINKFTDPTGREYNKINPSIEKRIMSEDMAAKLGDFMLDVVAGGSGSSAAVSGVTVAGKTGTVQVAGQENNALFIGYVDDEEYPLAVAIVVEEGVSGGGTAAPMAAEILRMAVNKMK